MTTEELPIYPQLSTINNDELLKIQKKCRGKGHLDFDENLLDRINEDLFFLQSKGIKKEDIYKNHRNMYLKYNKTNKYNAFTTDNHGDHHIELVDNLPENFGNDWSGNGLTTNEIELNGQHLRVSCIVWNGAEECPIEKSFSNKYHGYERGDRDWFITNLDKNINIWIPDLVPAQAGMFGFFQSPSSPYRIDPKKYIEVFNITGEINILETIETYEWGLGAGSYSDDFMKKFFFDDENTKQIDENEKDIYKAYLFEKYYGKNLENRLCILFKDDEWVKENRDETIIVFNYPLPVSSVFATNGYLEFRQCKIINLKENDESDSINKIKNNEMLKQMKNLMEMIETNEKINGND